MKILFVEDEADIRELVIDALEAEGAQVIAACNGSDAIAQLSGGEQFDAIVSDVAMPGDLTGIDVAAAAAAACPGTRVILASGHALSHLPALPGNAEYMAKPYRVRQLIQLLQTPH